MSGPVSTADVPGEGPTGSAGPCPVEITESRTAQVGSFRVRRALPRRARRTVGAWCFVDHVGPGTVTEHRGLDIGPHPHIGLQTVTWLIRGEALHRDSLGSEQVIRPGQLNLMTAGRGVSHSEEATGRYHGDLHGVQLWVAQPDAARHGDPEFQHLPELPTVALATGVATVLVGDFAGAASTGRRDTDHVGIDLDVGPGEAVLPLDPGFEYAIVVLDGTVAVDGCDVEAGHLGYLGTGRDEVGVRASHPSRALMVGGVPFPEPVLMWWNYVARTRSEISAAHREWIDGGERFGHVDSSLGRMVVGPPPWIAV